MHKHVTHKITSTSWNLRDQVFIFQHITCKFLSLYLVLKLLILVTRSCSDSESPSPFKFLFASIESKKQKISLFLGTWFLLLLLNDSKPFSFGLCKVEAWGSKNVWKGFEILEGWKPRFAEANWLHHWIFSALWPPSFPHRPTLCHLRSAQAYFRYSAIYLFLFSILKMI